ncbi:hypothetical protein LQ327_18690 [Actinomycetospora endophytica]|uniref:CYTH domain-containing protein n=1 Tax=Actinomycetospora endophytica TaxID=2291215 RepID=A0ABS8PDC1_9PSEU|nr:hypothetical protein [Actinomycetospora endophytica]MCD2195401.1 hypothetical protein [Actinomycetospora endophytica]
MGRRSEQARVFPSPRSDDWQRIVDEGVDSVEVKILLGPAADAAAAALTGRTTSRWRLRRVYLLDTPDLDFARSGVEMRLRRRARGRHDLTVRARRRHGGARRPQPPGARVEFDVLPGAVWHTVELRRDVDASLAEAVAAGSAFPRELLTGEQEEWMRAAAGSLPAAALATSLVVHGPLRVSRVGVPDSRFRAGRAHLEHCRYPSGRELVEFSTRCPPESAGRVAEEVTRFLASQGVAPSRSHATKTAIWLDELTRCAASDDDALPTPRPGS